MKNERKIWYGMVAGIIAVVAIGGIFFGGGGGKSENFQYLYSPGGAYHYAGEIKIDDAKLPEVTSVPNLMLTHRSFNYEEAKSVSTLFGMKNPHVEDFQSYYDISTKNESLTIYKNGYKIMYTKEKVDMVNVTMDNSKLIGIANGYLNKFKDYIPKNVNIKVHSVINDRLDVTADENETIETYYTKDVIYDCYYKGYFVGLILNVELDHNGNLAGFHSMPVKVSQNGYINIKSFSKVHRWMESRLPVTVPPKLIKSVEIKDIRFGYLPNPTSYGAAFKPAYIVDIHIEGMDPAANDDYTLDIGGIEG